MLKKFKDKTILVLGAGNSTLDVKWENLDYDYLWTCNQFFLLDRIDNVKVDLVTLGYNVGRLKDYVYHLEHARGENSWFNNPHMINNQSVWEEVKSMNKEQLMQYYSEQDYLQKYDAGI